MTCGFLIQLVYSAKKKKTSWLIGVEVEQRTTKKRQKIDFVCMHESQTNFTSYHSNTENFFHNSIRQVLLNPLFH